MTNTTCDINKSNIDYYRDLLIGKIFTVQRITEKDRISHMIIYDIEFPIDSYLPYAKLHMFNISRNKKITWTNDPLSFGPFIYGLIDILDNSTKNEYYVKGYVIRIEK